MSVTKLQGQEDYPNFKRRMKLLFEAKGIWDVVIGSPPNADAAPEVKKAWLEKDTQARLAIVSALSDRIFQLFYNLDTSKKLWDALETQYEPKSVAAVALLAHRLFETKLTEGGDLEGHIASFRRYGDQLAERNHMVSDSMMAHLLVRSLPPSYDMWRTAAMNMDEKTFTFDHVRSLLIREKDFRASLESNGNRDDGVETAMLMRSGARPGAQTQKAQQQQQQHQRRQGGSKERRCFMCNSAQHLIKDCPEKASSRQQSGASGVSGNGGGASTRNTEHARQVRASDAASSAHNASSANTSSNIQEHKQDSRVSNHNNSGVQSSVSDGAPSVEICFMMRANEKRSDDTTTRAKYHQFDAYLDSAASHTMTPHLCLLMNIRPSTRSVLVGDNRTVPAVSEGDMIVRSPLGNITINDVMYVPQLANTLISVGQLVCSGYNVTFGAMFAKVKDAQNKVVFGAAFTDDKMYRVIGECVRAPHESAFTVRHVDALTHYRLGHVGASTLTRLVKEKGADGLPEDLKVEGIECEGCVYGKQTRSPFTSTSSTNATECLELTHTDVGVIRNSTLNGYMYWCTFLDDYSGRVVVALMKHKNHVLAAFKEYKKYAERQMHPLVLKRVRSDNGGEYIGEFARYLASCGIQHELTVPYTPQWNPRAERLNGTLVQMTRSMMHHMNVPEEFCGEGLKTAAYIINRLISRSAREPKTAFEFWYKKKPNLSHLRVFGCVAYAHVQIKSSKFAPRAIKCMFVGYNDDTRSWRLWEPESGKYIRSRDVTFHESQPFFTYDAVSKSFVEAPTRNAAVTNDAHMHDDAKQCDADVRDAGAIDHYPNNDEHKSVRVDPAATHAVAHAPHGAPHVAHDANAENDNQHVAYDADYVGAGEFSEDNEVSFDVPEELSEEEEEEHESHVSESEIMTHATHSSASASASPPVHANTRARTRIRNARSDASDSSYNESSASASASLTSDSASDVLNSRTRARRGPTSSSARQNGVRARHADENDADRRYPSRIRGPPRPHWIENQSVADENAFAAIAASGDTSPPSPDPESIEYDEPRSYGEALRRSDAPMWRAACEEEMISQEENDSWSLVKRPRDAIVLRCQWVFKIKLKANRRIERYKARLCADGRRQEYGVNYTDTYAPVVKMATIRTLLALVALYNLELDQMDVKTAFLNGVLDEIIYMEQPPGFIQVGRDLVCKLNKTIYGLKQSPRVWYLTISKFLAKLGYTRVECDYGLYVRWTDDVKCIISLYVDDLLLACNSREHLTELKRQLSQEYKMSDLGTAEYILGIQLHRDRSRRQVYLTQSHYLERVLERFGMSDCKSVSTPIDNQSIIVENNGEVDENLRKAYQSAVGSLMYAMTCTRPDLAFAVGLVSRFCSNPSEQHWTVVKRIFRYIRGTSQYRLCLGAPCAPENTSNIVVGYCDADWASDVNQRKSTSGYVFYLGCGPITWRSKRQSSVALSTAEAEYISASAACQEALWVKELLKQVGIDMSKPIRLFNDNQSAISLARNPVQHSRTKHIAIRYHFLRDQVEQGVIDLAYCSTQDNVADVFTKGLPKVKHQFFVDKLSLSL